jgi:hypothetical protein
MNGFVYSIGQQHLLGRKSEMASGKRFDRPAIRITGKILGRNPSQTL